MQWSGNMTKRTSREETTMKTTMTEIVEVGASLRFFAKMVAKNATSPKDRDRAVDACDDWDEETKIAPPRIKSLVEAGTRLRFFAEMVAKNATSTTDRDRAGDACDYWDVILASLDGARIKRIQISAPRTPGAAAAPAWWGETLAEARVAARERFGQRRDLCYQDVRIELATGALIEYAGPCR